MAMAFTPNFRSEMARVMDGAETSINMIDIATQKSRRLWPEYLRYCPICADEDSVLFGEPYWHRVHQLPGMAYCMKHRVRIMSSGVKMHETMTMFRPASDEIRAEKHDAGLQDGLMPFKKAFLQIGRESEWLLRHGADIDWGANGQEKYRRLLRENGVATIQGIMDYEALSNNFNRYWGEDFLEALCEETSDFREWTRQIQGARMVSFRPLYHILLMCFLKGSVKAFLECDASENPFGIGPWLCENPVCHHYHVGGAVNTDVRYMNGIAIGFFHCPDCGMRYKRIKHRSKSAVPIILEYGRVWEDAVERCLCVEKMPMSEIAEKLKCSRNAIEVQRKKLGLCGKRLYKPPPRRYDPNVGLEVFYKDQVLAICGRYNEVTPKLLQEYVPGAYSYLRKHNSKWLSEQVVYERNCAAQRDYDLELMRKAQEAVAKIRNEGDPKRRLNVGWIAGVAGVKVNEFSYAAENRPQTQAFLATVVEGKEDWLRRRITLIWQTQKAEGKPIAIADVKREMSLKPNTYVKDKEFIDAVIAELNQRTD